LRPGRLARTQNGFFMSLAAPQYPQVDGAGFSVGIVAARYNHTMVDALLQQVTGQLQAAGVKEKKIRVYRVPGSNELPTAVQYLAKAAKSDVIVALGVIIRGDTLHYELVAEASSQGLMRVALDSRIPVINGVIVAENQKQAADRCLGKINRGAEFARAALEMAGLKRRFSK
jgi:6,7-dimethyl-8-ribityllumazine synthase